MRELRGDDVEVSQLAEVREAGALHPEGAHALDAGAGLGGVEVRGARRGEGEATRALETGCAEDERYSREDRRGGGVDDDEVVVGVSAGVHEAQRSVAEGDLGVVVEGAHARASMGSITPSRASKRSAP